ncbi:hypothetical protein CDAR_490401 [Caerostris darwini]|uniref:Uncharacterized protein n=1 Tax=Caerostris darwini TaxID=1538125 RepID=A0AAV4WVN9_9ARAC|nr:hypothetical protein CDAR_490401 [Caerostris darwini]
MNGHVNIAAGSGRHTAPRDSQRHAEIPVHSKGNGPFEIDQEVPSPANADASTTVTPEGMCRQLVTALKILDDILTSTKNSDMP